MSKPTIFYVFRRPIKNSLHDIYLRKSPEDITYGLTRMHEDYTILVTDKAFKNRIIPVAQFVLNRIVLHFIDIGFSLIPSLLLLSEIRKSDLIFATVDTYGLPLALLKKIRLYNKPLIINTIGLYDGLAKKKNILSLWFCKKILTQADFFVSSGSFQECQKLSSLLNISIQKFKFIPFGIDTVFFKPGVVDESDEILIIGADPSRDWALYVNTMEKFPDQIFRIITYRGIIKNKMPKNTRIEYDLPYLEIRKRIMSAKCILILSKFNYHFAGQSTAFRAMSCGKPVIFTQTPGVDEYDFKNGIHCFMVAPGNREDVVNSLNKILTSKKMRQKLSKNARHIMSSHYSIEKYSNELKKIFRNFVGKT